MQNPSRRTLLTAAAATAATPWLHACATHPAPATDASKQLAALEASAGGRLGVMALTPSGMQAAYRPTERFPACSTFKALLAATVLRRSTTDAALLPRRVQYGPQDLTTYAPVTRQHVADGMTVEALCVATVQHSDNVAANLLMRLLGAPQAVTAFVRTLGDATFRLDRWEPELNSALPGDPRDTCTPADMARDLQKLVLGDALAPAQRRQLTDWLRGNTTGGGRIRAGVPAGWTVGDKTGTGDYGTTNDIGVVWPTAGGEPIVLAVYFTQTAADAKPREDVVAAATRLAVAALAG